MPTSATSLQKGITHFLAARLARPELANALWIGSVQPASSAKPLRRWVRMGVSDSHSQNVDLLGDLDALPFRDQQFQGVVVGTGFAQMSSVAHAEQLYRVLHERALLILVGSKSQCRGSSANLFGLFRKRRWLTAKTFASRYGTWPMQPLTVWHYLNDAAASWSGFLPASIRVEIYEKVTPPPPGPGLTQPARQSVASGMPSPSLAHSPVSRLAKG